MLKKLHTSIQNENRMNELTGSSPDRCVHCRNLIWADDELGAFVDVTALSNAVNSGFCHEVGADFKDSLLVHECEI